MKKIILAAGIYNIIWGAFNILFPLKMFQIVEAKLPAYPEIWQCVGMIVGVYGLGYIIAASSPLRHWPIILVGFLGKIFGPIGFVYSIMNDVFPLSFGINIIFNDLIWWIPFALILFEVFKHNKISEEIIHFKRQDIDGLSDRYRAQLINGLSGFKSANLIGTQDQQKRTNLAIVSSVFHLGSHPPLMGFIIRPDSVRRDTIENLRSNPYFTINHVHESFFKNAHQTSARYAKEQSEFDQCGLHPEYIGDFNAPFVQESKIKIGLKMIREEKIPENGTLLIIAEIQYLQLPADCLRQDGSIHIEKAGSVAVSGLDQYHDTTTLARLSYAKVDKKVEEVF
ncbi:MAG: hypothetical protein OHK0056_26040 [Bacteriovoracaceae bacterium]